MSEDHKRRVMRVQAILFDFTEGRSSEADALALLEEAGVSNGGANEMLSRHRPRTTFRAPSLWPRPPEPPRAA